MYVCVLNLHLIVCVCVCFANVLGPLLLSAVQQINTTLWALEESMASSGVN